ncbi:hypothetical protein TNCV_4027531 [Trichonephila clavipes]|nr:hypothetical protein TNCV_4027531 [Trichonephila clavipes]
MTNFRAGDGIFQDDNAPIHATGLVDEYEDEVKLLALVFVHIVIKPLWSTLERSIRNRYPFLVSLPNLQQYLQEEMYNIPLSTYINRFLVESKLYYMPKAVLHPPD